MKVSVGSILLLIIFLTLIYVNENIKWPLKLIITGILMLLVIFSSRISESIPVNHNYFSTIDIQSGLVSELGGDGDEIAKYAKDNTPKEVVFLTPPTWGQFRIAANRAIVVDFKAFPFSDMAILEWYQRINDCYGESNHNGFNMIPDFRYNYSRITDARLSTLAKKYGAGLAVLYTETPTNFDILYANASYKLVKID